MQRRCSVTVGRLSLGIQAATAVLRCPSYNIGGTCLGSNACSRVTSSTSSTITSTTRACMNLAVRAASSENGQPSSTSERDDNGGRGSTAVRKAFVAKKSVSGYQSGGKGGGAELSKGKKGGSSISTKLEMELNSMAPIPGQNRRLDSFSTRVQ